MTALSTGQTINIGNKTLMVEITLGSGAFGTVFKVYDTNTQDRFALKEIKCEGQDEHYKNKIIREVQTLRKVDHERIVHFLDFDFIKVLSTTYFFILTEFCSGGDLNSRLDESSSADTNMKWIKQLSEALCYLHSLNPPIVHRDLKADNVLLKDRISEDLKLGDFGLAREYEALKNIDGNPESVVKYYMSSAIGPLHWMAPEFFASHYTEKADIFSLGGIFYAILARDFIITQTKKMYGAFVDTPFGKAGLGYAQARIDRDAKIQFAFSFTGSDTMKALIQSMMNYDPNERPNANTVANELGVNSLVGSCRLM